MYISSSFFFSTKTGPRLDLLRRRGRTQSTAPLAVAGVAACNVADPLAGSTPANHESLRCRGFANDAIKALAIRIVKTRGQCAKQHRPSNMWDGGVFFAHAAERAHIDMANLLQVTSTSVHSCALFNINPYFSSLPSNGLIQCSRGAFRGDASPPKQEPVCAAAGPGRPH